MEILYQSAFKTTTYEAELSLITNIWTDKPMETWDFQNEILVWADLVEKYKPKNLIADTKKFNFIVSVELQTWTNHVIFPRLINSGVLKFAVIETDDVVNQMSLEQTMEEETTGQFRYLFFKTMEEARNWVKKS